MIYELLGEGERSARTGKELAKLLGVQPRDISKAVERERREGKPICATCDKTNPGYYIAEYREDMKNYCDRLFHRAGEIHKTRRLCLATMVNLPAREAVPNEQNRDQ